MNLRPVLQRLPVERGDQLGNGEVPKLPNGAQRRWSAVCGEACGESVFTEKLSMEGRHLASGPGRENSVACREAERVPSAPVPMVCCSLILKGPASRSS